MGILNATPDSFFPSSRVQADDGVARGLNMVAEGAGILDIGGESTRPGAAYIEADEEIRRVVPLIQGLVREGCSVPISIDTRKYSTARAAYEAGARWLNDVSALEDDPKLGPFAAETAMKVVLMHRQGDPATMQKSPHYDDVAREVREALLRRVDAALSWGIRSENLVLDPGIGFGKSLAHTLELVRSLPLLISLGFPVLVGLSRKSFLAKIDQEAGVSPAGVDDRLVGSISGAIAMLEHGVSILRVHDVGETSGALRAWNALKPRRN